MRQELIDQTQDMAATATAVLESFLNLRVQILAEIESMLDDPSKANRINSLDKQLRDIDIAIGQVRIYLLDFHSTLVSAQALAQGKIEIPPQIVQKEKPWLVKSPKF